MVKEDACHGTGIEIEQGAWRTFRVVIRNFCGYFKA